MICQMPAQQVNPHTTHTTTHFSQQPHNPSIAIATAPRRTWMCKVAACVTLTRDALDATGVDEHVLQLHGRQLLPVPILVSLVPPVVGKHVPGRDAQTSATPMNASSTIARFTRKLSSISTSWKLCRSTVSKCLRVDTFSVWPRRASPTACAAALASPVVEPAKALSARTRSRKPRCPTSPYELRVRARPRSSKRASRGHPSPQWQCRCAYAENEPATPSPARTSDTRAPTAARS